MVRRRGGILVGILLLLPAVLAALFAARLALAAWPVAAAGGEPIVVAVIGVREAEPALTVARDLAPLDFNYPRELGDRVRDHSRVNGWNEGRTAQAWDHYTEAALRAPTDAETRFHLSGIAWRRGDADEADRQARAALLLAPLFRELRDRIGTYFQARFRQTRDDAHLIDAVRALKGQEERLTAGVLDDPLLSFDQVRAAFRTAGMTFERQLSYLEGSGRWDWAIQIARESDRSAGGGFAREAGVRSRLAVRLLRSGKTGRALGQMLRAHALDPGAVTDHLLLGRAFLDADRAELAGPALLRHLRETGRVQEIESALVDDRASSAWCAEWWGLVIEAGVGGDAARLARARAVVADRRLGEAHRLLKELTDSRTVGAEACFTLARAHREFGDPSVALRYARQAVVLDRQNREYLRLLRILERGTGK